MLLLSTLATLAALLIAGATIASVLERFVTEGLDERLDSQVALLASTIDADGRIDRERLNQRVAAMEGAHGWRWQIESPSGAIGSRDFPALDPAPPPPGLPPPGPSMRREPPAEPEGRLGPLEGASEDGTPVHARRLTLRTRGGPVTLTAAAPRDVIRRPVRSALVPLIGILAVLAVLLGVSTLVQLRWGLRPLRRLRDQLAELRAGTRRSVDEDQPTELRPFAAELNALAAQNAAALAAARQSAANLAHALKTPVAALALDVQGDASRMAQVARIDATIRHHLTRARVQAVNHRTATTIEPAITDLVETVRRIHHERHILFDVDVAPSLRVALDANDFDELLGNLLDNAARHANGTVAITASVEGDDARFVCIAVSDDGPGIPAAERARVSEPGIRLDERGDGHGFGLAIAVELTALYGGQFTLENSALGGLSALVVLPAAT